MVLAAWLFGAGGVVLAGIGVFFLFLRPPLLAEDLRFLDRDSHEIAEFMPQLGVWLRRVFTVLGGHALAAGLLIMYVSAAGVRDGDSAAVAVLVVAGCASIGVMTVVNFAIRSDFRWALAGCGALWVAATAAALAS